MPPKGSGINEEVCSSTVPAELRTWITVKNAARHLQSRPHLQAVDQIEEARKARERLQKEREADSVNAKLQEAQFAARNYSGPVASASSTRMSDTEAEMWADYRLNGADFTTGDGNESPDEQLKKLGFGPEDDEMHMIAAEDEEDDFLADVMRNIVDMGERVKKCLARSKHGVIEHELGGAILTLRCLHTVNGAQMVPLSFHVQNVWDTGVCRGPRQA
ncbi:hypothetical protein FB451DRAFT_1470367 [Mycena latifolia]|nr:hypothetical protein FB451DRAFT_1470367 [Mycena latifolia]